MQNHINESEKFHGAVGDRIRTIRESKECSQKTLSRRSGLSQSQLSRIEAGERAASLISLTKIARALRITPGYLMKISV